MLAAKKRGREIVDRADAEAREITAQERAAAAVEMEIINDCRRQLEAMAVHSSSDDEMRGLISRLGGGATRGFRPGDDARLNVARSWGDHFVASEAFREVHDRLRGGGIPQGPWTSQSVELPIGATTLTEDAASGGDLVLPEYQQRIVPLPQRRIWLLDLILPGKTGSNAVGYFKETTFTNAADAVAEGGALGESAMVFDAVTDPVQAIGTWIPCSQEILEDSDLARSYVGPRLQLGVNLKLEDQLLNGNGTAPNISGILDRSGLATDVARGADTNADAILKQIHAIATAEQVQPDGIVMHPNNWQTILLSKDGDGNYYAGGGPFSPLRTPTLWGLPVAVTPLITANTALVGCFGTFSQAFIRHGVRVEVSNSHSDFFIKRLLAIRASVRAALAIYRPSAFGKVTGLN
jgi:HK97 family phage major capsid protein